MALQTKIFNGTTGSSYWTWKIEVIEQSIDEDNNTSLITIKSYLGRKSTAGSSYFAGTATFNYGAGGQTYSESKSFNTTNVGAGAFVLVGSHNFNVVHTTEPITITASGSMSNATFSPTTASASGSMTLTEIVQGIFRLGDTTWKKATAYLGVNGVWKKCKAYLGVNGSWKKGV